MDYVHRLETIPEHDYQGMKVRVLAGKQSMVFFGKLPAGSHAPRHKHPNEQITWLRSGRIESQIDDGETQTIEPGGILLIPADTYHAAWYPEDCEIVEFFSPPRLDMFPAAAHHPYALG